VRAVNRVPWRGPPPGVVSGTVAGLPRSGNVQSGPAGSGFRKGGPPSWQACSETRRPLTGVQISGRVPTTRTGAPVAPHWCYAGKAMAADLGSSGLSTGRRAGARRRVRPRLRSAGGLSVQFGWRPSIRPKRRRVRHAPASTPFGARSVRRCAGQRPVARVARRRRGRTDRPSRNLRHGFQISGQICTGQFPRLTDWMNMQQGSSGSRKRRWPTSATQTADPDHQRARSGSAWIRSSWSRSAPS